MTHCMVLYWDDTVHVQVKTISTRTDIRTYKQTVTDRLTCGYLRPAGVCTYSSVASAMLWSPALWLDVVSSWVVSLRGRPPSFQTVSVKRKSEASEHSWWALNVTGLITLGLLTLWRSTTPSSDSSLKHDRLVLRNTEHVHLYLPIAAIIPD